MQTQGFRFSFTPLPGFFSPFLHSTLLYRSPGSIQPCGVVPAPSHRVSRVPWYSGCRHSLPAFAYGAFTLYGRSSQDRSAGFPRSCFCGSLPRRAPHAGLGSFPFARRYSGNRCFFLFLRLLRCFSSPGSPPCTIMPLPALFMHGCMRVPHAGFPIQTPMAQRVFAPPHGFSQLVASFFGSWCQGIRPVPFLA